MKVKKIARKSACLLLSAGMIFSGLPETGGFSVFAAQYVVQDGEIPTTASSLADLPSTVNCVEEGTSIQTPKSITWEISDNGSFYNAGSTIDVTGTITENSQKVTASILALPENVVYLVDSNVSDKATSVDYTALTEKGDISMLKNEVPDQTYSSGSWGYTSVIGTDITAKGSVSDLSGTKSRTGYYANSNKNISYTLPLEAGTYIVAGEFAEWWGSYSRTIETKVTYTDSSSQSKTDVLSTVILGNKNSVNTSVGSFTIDSDQSVILTFDKKSSTSSGAVLSGFTVLKSDNTLPSDDAIQVTVDGSQVDPANTFGGFGSVTCNNTSRLLMDYKALHEDQYWEMMNLLFSKEDGAGLNHVKIELGADVNSSSGTEPATMRSPDDTPNVKRGAGFSFAADAISINPDVTVEILRWGEPKWTQEGTGYEEYAYPKYEARYQWYRKTIDAAYETYGYKITEVSPGQNERRKDYTDDFAWIKYCAQRFDEDGANGVGAFDYREIKIVAADLYRGMDTTVDYLMNDEELRDLVDIISDHYQIWLGSEDLTTLNQEYGKEIWYGESTAPMINAEYRNNVDPDRGGIGGSGSIVAMAERFIAAYAYKNSDGYASRMTELLYQPAIGAFYEGSAYSPKQLIGAFDPWSGYYEADGGIQMTEHFMKFTDSDWNYLPDACNSDGTKGDGDITADTSTDTRLVLKDPDTDDYSMIFANNTSTERTYRLTLKNLKTSQAAYNVWETRGPDEGDLYDANWFQKITDGAYPTDNGDGTSSIELTVKPYSIITLTSLTDRGSSYESGQNDCQTERTVLELPYRDSFDYDDSFVEERGGTPLYTTDLEGAFEVQKSDDTGYELTQMINNDNRPYNWNPWGSGSDESSQTTGTPWTVLGDHRWANYTAGIDVKLDTQSNGYGDNFAVLGARELVHSSGAAYRAKIYANGKWELLRFSTVKKSGTISNFNPDLWHKLQLKTDENVITMYVDGEEMGSFTDSSSAVMTGRIALMSGFWNTSFDNLEVIPIDGKTPYSSDKIDDTSSLISWDGSVTHNVVQGFAYYNRSYSAMASGSSLEFTVPDGVGFDIFGTSSSAKISVTVDGNSTTASTVSSGNRETTYWREDLDDGAHTVNIQVTSGTYNVDGINLLTGPYSEETILQTKELSDLVLYIESQTFDTGQYPESSIKKLETALDQAKALLSAPESQAEIDLTRITLRNALLSIIPSDTIISLVDTFEDTTAIQYTTPELPETVTVLNAAGEETEKNITWDVTEDDFGTLWSTVAVTGSVEDSNIKVSFNAYVIPYGLTYFIDSGTATVTNDEGEEGYSAAYDLVAGSTELKNDRSDKIYEEDSWGYVKDSSISTKSSDSVSYNTGIYDSGLYVDNYTDTDIVYKLPLEAGNYQFVVGSKAYWSETHSSDIEVGYETVDGEWKTVDLGTSTVSSSSDNIQFSASAEIPVDCVVELRIKKSNTKIHLVSWLAVSQAPEIELPSTIITENGTLPELPDTIYVDGEEEAVTWNGIDEEQLDSSWSNVTAKGLITRLGLPVTTTIEVIPKDLIYFIDSAALEKEDSTYYSLVNEKVGGLKNEVPDQPYEESSWGYVNDGQIGGSMGSESDSRGKSGWWASTDQEIIYKLPLEAGTYQFDSGFYEWWSVTRPLETYLVYQDLDGQTVSASLGKITISKAQEYILAPETALEIPTDQTVEFRVKKTGSSDPVISWLAVNAVTEDDDTDEPDYQTTRIKVTQKPDKTEYEVGDSLDTTGMEVTRYETSEDANEKTVILNEGEYELDYDFTETGKNTVTVSYTDLDASGEEKTFTDTFTVTVKEIIVEDEYYTTKIQITREPNKTSYTLGEDLDTQGLQVTEYQKASPSNATKQNVLTEDDYALEYDFSMTGTRKVKVIFYGVDKKGEEKAFSDIFTVNVTPAKAEIPYLTGIWVAAKPNKTRYYVGDTFNPEGLVVNGQICQTDGTVTTEAISLEDLEYNYDFSISGKTDVIISCLGTDKDGIDQWFKTTLSVRVYQLNDSEDDVEEITKEKQKNSTDESYFNGTWKQDENGWTLVGKDGKAPVNQWAVATWDNSENWYFFDENGYMKTGWFQYEGNMYYLNPVDGTNKGRMLTGWQMIDGKWYYFHEESDGSKGTMLKDTVTPDGYSLDENGAWIP